MRKLPVVSGEKLIKVLGQFGYEMIRQKGSQIGLRKIAGAGDHNITVPMHNELAKGTLNDILSDVSI